MSKIYIPSAGPDSWQQFLADPQKQWRTGYSAKSLAHSWEDADGFPTEISTAMSGVEDLDGAEPLLVIPEHKVPLPGGRTESQNDAFVLATTPAGLASICIEGKVNESFGEPVSKWGPDSSPGKRKRFQYLTEVLELEGVNLSNIYYQLLHRTASAIIEAKRFHATTAMMLVHSFSQEHKWFPEFSAFAKILGATAELNAIHACGEHSGVSLYVGWVVGNPEYLKR